MSNDTGRRRTWTVAREEKARRLAAIGTFLDGKQVRQAAIVEVLQRLLRCGDRVALEGNNQKQADFLSRSLAQADSARLHDLHLLIGSIGRPEHLALFERGIARRLDFCFAGPQSVRLAQLLEQGWLEVGSISTYVELYARMFLDLAPHAAVVCAEQADPAGKSGRASRGRARRLCCLARPPCCLPRTPFLASLAGVAMEGRERSRRAAVSEISMSDNRRNAARSGRRHFAARLLGLSSGPTESALDAIWQVVCLIPRGRVSTYGAVARAAGLPGRARQVGYALRVAPRDLELPWHRVVGAGGRIVFPAASREHLEQARRLRAEGVRVREGRIPADALADLSARCTRD